MVELLHEGPPVITDRQRQVIELIAAGYSNEEVARRLGISAHGEGSLGRASPEARLHPAPADPECLPLTDRTRPALRRPRSGPGRLRGLTARACGPPGSQARSPFLTTWRADESGLAYDRGLAAPEGRTGRRATNRDPTRASPHHRTPAADAASGRDVSARNHARRARGLRQDHSCASVAGESPACLVSGHPSFSGHRSVSPGNNRFHR